MKTHCFHLNPEPFASVQSGNKTIESRLYDAKRQVIQNGDSLTFYNRDDTNQFIVATVTQLHHYSSFHELFTSQPPQKFGKTSIEELERQIALYYSPDDEEKYGVLGIEFDLSRPETKTL